MAGHVVSVGSGGNIGSHFVEYAARMPAVSRLTLVDHGFYEKKNLVGQRIDLDDVGRAKVDVQAKRIRRIRPDLEVVAIPERVQEVPLGRLRGDVIVTGLDNRRARQVVNESARRLGVPWIDGAVQAEGMLVRVNVYGAAESGPCGECAWSPRDYDNLDQRRPCQPDAEAPPTNAPASLGALAASLQAIECGKLLKGEETVLDGRQVLLDARHHTHYLTAFGRNEECRLADHGPWSIDPLDYGPADPTLGELVDEAPGATSLEVFGRRFVTALVCPECARRLPIVRVAGKLRAADRVCPDCTAEMVASGFHTVDALDVERMLDAARTLSVRDLGVRGGDVLVLSSPSEMLRRFEVSFTNHSDEGKVR
jgi:molybdopterin/thiamine biosynthesis adenylyltransferase